MCCCRSTARVTTGQRVSLNSIESAVQESRDGLTYWVYEHLSQVIITKSNNALYITILLPLRQGGCPIKRVHLPAGLDPAHAYMCRVLLAR